MQGEKILSVDAKETQYNIAKEESGWVVIAPNGQKIDVADFNPIESERHSDGTMTYKLYGAYTHLLRKVL